MLDLSQPSGRPAIIGGGRAGLAAARYLQGRKCPVRVVDDLPEDAMRARLDAAGLHESTVASGGLSEAALADADWLVLSPGVPRAHPALVAAARRGVPIVNEIELGAAALERPTVLAITGTNGKSTTATLAGAIARAFDADAFVGGNLGPPLCEAIAEGARPRLLVLELSSYQLETIAQLSVRAAVVTNLSPDHLDRYPSVDEYYLAKAKIFALVREGGGSVLNHADPLSLLHLDGRTQGTRLDFDVPPGRDGVALVGKAARVQLGDDVTEVDLNHPSLMGHHNLQNAAAAVAGAALCGIPPEAWREGLRRYNGIPHRMERVAESGGVLWINDTKATNVDAAVKAVRSFEAGVHLIVGGKGKGASYAPLSEAAAGRVKTAYCIGEEAQAMANALDGAARVELSGDLETAMRAAATSAVEGDVVLLAPACSSFDQFENYAIRGESFRRIANQLSVEVKTPSNHDLTDGSRGGAS